MDTLIPCGHCGMTFETPKAHLDHLLERHAKKVPYTFCESVISTSGILHLRPLTSMGRKLKGEVDTDSLCGAVAWGRGWDLKRPITGRHLDAETGCKACSKEYRRRRSKRS